MSCKELYIGDRAGYIYAYAYGQCLGVRSVLVL